MRTFYVRFRVFAIWHFRGTYPQIYQCYWSHYMQIHYIWANFLGPYISIAYNEGRLYSQYILMFYLQCQRVRGPEADCEKSCEPFGGKKSWKDGRADFYFNFSSHVLNFYLMNKNVTILNNIHCNLQLKVRFTQAQLRLWFDSRLAPTLSHCTSCLKNVIRFESDNKWLKNNWLYQG